MSVFLEAPGPSLLAFSHGGGGCPWTVTPLAGKLWMDGVQETLKCDSQPLCKRPPGKRAQSLTQFLIVRVILSVVGDRKFAPEGSFTASQSKQETGSGHPAAAARAVLWVLCCWLGWCA